MGGVGAVSVLVVQGVTSPVPEIAFSATICVLIFPWAAVYIEEQGKGKELLTEFYTPSMVASVLAGGLTEH